MAIPVLLFFAKFKKALHIPSKEKKQISNQWTAIDPEIPPLFDSSDSWAVAVSDGPWDTPEPLFNKGDILNLERKVGERLWMVRNSRTGNSGKVQDDFFTDRPGESMAFDAWQNIGRDESRKQLLVTEFKSGTYILRPGRGREFILWAIVTRMLQMPQLPTGTQVAVKEALGPQTTKESIDEAKLLSTLRHPRILCLLAICCEPNTEPLLLITEFMPKGSLLDFLATAEGRAFSVENLIRILSQAIPATKNSEILCSARFESFIFVNISAFKICEGMAYLEEHKVVHNDLRAANVLIDEDNNVRVADFGLAKILRADDPDINTGLFPIRWTAPEATGTNYIAKSSADIWSFGVLMYEVLSYGGLPYDKLTDDEVLDHVASGERLRNPCKSEWNQGRDLYGVMLRCWHPAPEKRPAFQALKDEPLFAI
ncbi:unnamed protein product [Schistocephalus solidus]|uniref:Protein kinase domain-containing protein n=1 Tax=Schistocephalus solidus TaxID=70667 RepID=A0A183SPY9_SCHSO|nr:unnamed protein product [Schistocephalus solidus]